jgi:hypothetical protein
MGNLTLDLIILAAAIVTAIIIAAIDRRSKKKGSILGDKITPDGWQTWNNNPTPPPLPFEQSEPVIGSLDEQEEIKAPNRRPGEFFTGNGMLMVMVLVVLVAAFLAAAFPESKFSEVVVWGIVIGVIVLFTIGQLSHILLIFLEFIRKK